MNLVRRTRLRLALRDISAATAFTAIALSGSVPTWALGAFAVALIASLLGVRPLAHRAAWSAVLLLVASVLLFGAAFRGVIDLLVAACTFAGLVTCHRMLSSPTSGTDQQVHLTSLLMLSGAAALSGELWFGLCLTVFAITASLSLGLGVLEGPDPEVEIPVRPVIRGLSLAVVFALVGGTGFFVLFPRLSWNLAARRTPPGVGGGTTGMSDRVSLGGSGDLKSSPRVVARIKVTPDPKSDSLDEYFIGRTFDRFDGRDWLGSGRPGEPKARVMLGEVRGNEQRQQIELLPAYDARTLIGMATPLLFQDAFGVNALGQTRVALVNVAGEEVRFAQGFNAYNYIASSSKRRPETNPRPDDRYTELPTLDARVTALADKVIGDEKRPKAAAARASRWLQRNLSYSLELSGNVDDPLADFLFVRKAGHCEHFATALTVLLRAKGFSARVAAGFFGGERVGERYVLRAGDAHAWTQVWDEDDGWVTVDATPESGRGTQPSTVLAWATARYEALEEWWRQRVVDYSFQDQVDFARNLVRPPASAGPTSTPAMRRLQTKPLMGAIAAAALVYVLTQVLWRRGGRHSRHAAASFLDQIEKRVADSNIERRPNEPLEELARRIEGSDHPLARPLKAATDTYLRARFGGASLGRVERQRLLKALQPQSSE